ncbi:inositol monophosphatase family protein [Buchnera aphidicola (Chaitoregma tattakana)]|uniref:inositol monophosphatase family protein n=1 Tax=Buchnera aphidicola TaxID=9 RepID=UPI0031B81BDE
MNPIVNIAISAVRKAGNFVIKYYDSYFFLEKNIKNFLFFEEVIKKTESIIIKEIFKYYPNHIYFTNKNNDHNFSKEKMFWFINSLNGYKNFSSKFPHFCILISYFIKKNIFMSVIYDPLRNELFTAVKGEGAKLNGYRMRCNNNLTDNGITIAINVPTKNESAKQKYIKIIKKLFNKNINIRITGSSVLDFVYVASGRLDCLIIEKENVLNFLSGELHVKESGGLTDVIFSKRNNFEKFNISIIGNNIFIKKIVSLINS